MTLFLRRRALFLPALAGVAAGLAGCSNDGSTDGVRLGPDAVRGRTPDATISLSAFQAAFIASGSGGEGVLHFRGRDYPFRVGGLGVGGIGGSTIEAEGDVYNLSDPARLAGEYGAARYGYAAGTASAGELWLQNPDGVILHLRARRTGLILTLGVDAMIITMSDRRS